MKNRDCARSCNPDLFLGDCASGGLITTVPILVREGSGSRESQKTCQIKYHSQLSGKRAQDDRRPGDLS